MHKLRSKPIYRMLLSYKYLPLKLYSQLTDLLLAEVLRQSYSIVTLFTISELAIEGCHETRANELLMQLACIIRYCPGALFAVPGRN